MTIAYANILHQIYIRRSGAPVAEGRIARAHARV